MRPEVEMNHFPTASPQKQRNSSEHKALAEPARESGQPPRVYFAACGALCDVFWWARRTEPPSES